MINFQAVTVIKVCVVIYFYDVDFFNPDFAHK